MLRDSEDFMPAFTKKLINPVLTISLEPDAYKQQKSLSPSGYFRTSCKVHSNLYTPDPNSNYIDFKSNKGSNSSKKLLNYKKFLIKQKLAKVEEQTFHDESPTSPPKKYTKYELEKPP